MTPSGKQCHKEVAINTIENNQSNMANDIKEIKDSLKEFRLELKEFVKTAYWTFATKKDHEENKEEIEKNKTQIEDIKKSDKKYLMALIATMFGIIIWLISILWNIIYTTHK